MTMKLGLLAFAVLAMAACANDGTGTVYPSGGGSAGAEGSATATARRPTSTTMETWEQQCMPGRR